MFIGICIHMRICMFTYVYMSVPPSLSRSTFRFIPGRTPRSRCPSKSRAAKRRCGNAAR